MDENKHFANVNVTIWPSVIQTDPTFAFLKETEKEKVTVCYQCAPTKSTPQEVKTPDESSGQECFQSIQKIIRSETKRYKEVHLSKKYTQTKKENF